MLFPEINIPGEGYLFARLITSLGIITVRLEEQRAPITVRNFVALVTGTIDWTEPKTGETMSGKSLYNGIRFHRVVPDFMIQCGDPFTRHLDMISRWGTGGPGYKFQDEFHPELRHDRAGTLSMANAGPGTNGSQWFITDAPTPSLDNKHSIFGSVVSGMDIVRKIATVPTTTNNRPTKDVGLQEIQLFRQ